jgi:hypothetical protein
LIQRDECDDAAIRAALLRQLFGAAGDGVEVQRRFACDYSYNIRIGRNAFINSTARRSRLATTYRWDRQSNCILPFIHWTGAHGWPGWNRRGLFVLVSPYGFAAERSFCRV